MRRDWRRLPASLLPPGPGAGSNVSGPRRFRNAWRLYRHRRTILPAALACCWGRRRKISLSGTAFSASRCRSGRWREILFFQQKWGTLRQRRGNPPFSTGKYHMRRVGLVLAALLGLVIPSAEATHPNRVTCTERDFVLCSLDRGSAGRFERKVSHSRTQRLGTRARTGVDPATKAAPAHAVSTTGARPTAATPAELLAARSFDLLASGSESAELRTPATNGADPWLNVIILALGARGALSLFVAKAADL